MKSSLTRWEGNIIYKVLKQTSFTRCQNEHHLHGGKQSSFTRWETNGILKMTDRDVEAAVMHGGGGGGRSKKGHKSGKKRVEPTVTCSLVVSGPEKGEEEQLRPWRPTMVEILFYVLWGVVWWCAWRYSTPVEPTVKLSTIDVLYYYVVTMTTVGYGDIHPVDSYGKVLMGFMIVFGLAFVYLPGRMCTSLMELLERCTKKVISRTKYADHFLEKGRVKTSVKLFGSFLIIVFIIVVGIVFIVTVEHLSYVDATYLTALSVTTVGYGDISVQSVVGRAISILWLSLSTFVVSRCFMHIDTAMKYYKEAKITARVLRQELTLGDAATADMDGDGYLTKAEYALFKLRKMGLVDLEDIQDIFTEFERLDYESCGKLKIIALQP